MEDSGLYPEFYQPMRCYEPNPLIERAEGDGDCEHCRKFLTDLCACRDLAIPEDAA